MRKSTLLLASALCVMNLGFAQNEIPVQLKSLDEIKVEKMSVQRPLQQFNFLKASEGLLKAPAQTTALSTPVAKEATEVDEYGFTANWNAVDGADAYYLQVNRFLETTTDAATILHLYEDFRLTTPGVVGDADNGALLFYEGQTMRDWMLYDGQTAEGAVEINQAGQLYTPLFDLSNEAVEATTTIYVDFVGTAGDQVDIGIVYVQNNQLYGGSVLQNPLTLGETGEIAGTLTFNSNPTYDQIGFYFETVNTNQAPVALKKFYCCQDMAAGKEWEMFFTAIETTATSQKVYTIEFDEDTPGVTEEFYYGVLAYNSTEESAFSNVIVVGGDAAIEDVVVSNDKVFVSDNLHVVLEAPAQVSVYNMTGALVGSYQGVEGDNEIALPASGVYVVKAGNTVVKVVK